jgi:hypothetical protein
MADFEEQIAALRASMMTARAELARTEASLAITRVALELRQAVLLDTELQLAQIANYKRALGIAKRANLDPLGPPRTEASLHVRLEVSSTYPVEPAPLVQVPSTLPEAGE